MVINYSYDFPAPPQVNSLLVAQEFLSLLRTRVSVTQPFPMPQNLPALVVSNHRSFMDAALLMVALNLPLHFACHHYMSQVPIVSEVVNQLGFLPFDQPKQRCHTFFERASQLLQDQQSIGIFPEGTTPMVRGAKRNSLSQFQRGFAHLALRAPVESLIVLPVAIAAQQELNTHLFPTRWLKLFDPSEPLFDRPGWHPFVLYHQVHVSIGKPIVVDLATKQNMHGKQAIAWVRDLTNSCQQEVQLLLRQSLLQAAL